MATEIKHRRGTTAEIEAFTPAMAELVVDVETNELVVGDGSKQGGYRTPTVVTSLRKFETKADLVAATYLQAGTRVETEGYTAEGDDGAARYLVKTSAQATIDSDIIDEVVNHTLANGNVVVIKTQTLLFKQCGFFGLGTSADTQNLIKGIEWASANKRMIKANEAEVLETVATISTFDEASATVLATLPILSGMNVDLNGATLKMADGQSSNGTPTHLRMFFSNEFQSNIWLKHGIIDNNGDNNLINGGTLTQAMFGFSGSAAGGTDVARGNNVRIHDVEFNNNAGVSCILMAQSNTTSALLGKDWKITQCKFKENGKDTQDHSSIYGWATDVTVDDCLFETAAPFDSTALLGGRVAYEVHGSGHKFINNTIKNYYQGVWVAANFTDSLVEGTLIKGNNFEVTQTAVDFYNQNIGGGNPNTGLLDRTRILGNDIVLLDEPTNDGYKACVRLTSKKGSSRILFANNECRSLETTDSSCLFLIVNQSDQLTTHDKIKVSNNQGSGLTAGLVVYMGGSGGSFDIGNVVYTDNDIYPLIARDGTFQTKDVYIYGAKAGNITDLEVSGMRYGLQNASALGTLRLRGIADNVPLTGTFDNVTVGNGTVTTRVTLNTYQGIATVHAKLVAGTTTSIGGNMLARFTGLTATNNSVGSGFVKSGANIHQISGRIDNTGSWVTMFNDSGNVNGTNPVTVASGDVYEVSSNFHCSSITL